MPMISRILLNVLHGKNSFCSLCFNNDQNLVFGNEISILIDETEQKIPLADILLSVFGNELQEYVSTFENVCKDCLDLIVFMYTFIQTCHNNAKSLIQALHRLNSTLNKTKDENDKETLFISIDIKNCTEQLIYHDKKIYSTKAALKHYNILQTKIQDVPAIKRSASLKKDDTIKIKHSDIVLDPNEELPRCKKCFKKYPSIYNLKAHYLRLHAPKVYKCTNCLKAFSSPSLLTYHMSTEHCEIVCSECGKKFNSKPSFIRHEMSHYLRLVCPDCGRIYKSSMTYKNHIETNLCRQECRANPANAQYTCDYCGKKYTQKMSLRVHIQHVHGNYKSHVCEWCGKKFWAQSRLKAHIVKHTKEKKFTCSICQGKFVSKESLLYHFRLHTGEKPYRCSQCDCSFISSSRRAHHLKTYHLEAAVECDNCHCKFTSLAYLNKHKKSRKECQNKQKDREKSYVSSANVTINTENNPKIKKSVDKNSIASKKNIKEVNLAQMTAEEPQINSINDSYILCDGTL